MKFLIWVILIFIVGRFVLRVFGKSIIAFAVKKLAIKMQQNMQGQQQANQRNYEPGAFNKSVYQDTDIHVTAPVQKGEKTPPKATDFAEDIDFEEIK